MKVVHINSHDAKGGAAESASKIHKGLKLLGQESVFFVAFKGNNTDSKYLVNNELCRKIEREWTKILSKFGLPELYYPFTHFFYLNSDVRKADIIQLYNLHGGYFELALLNKLSKKHAVVWRLSDMWPMTGHCAFPYDCEKWKSGCNNCPYLSEYPELTVDRSAFFLRYKQRIVSNMENMIVVAPSYWIQKNAKESLVFKGKRVHYIPNGIDEKVFTPFEKAYAKKMVGLEEKPVILFLAAEISDTRKGLAHLIQAFKHISNIENTQIVCVGNVDDEQKIDGIDYLGSIKDKAQMAIIYSSANVFAAPSLADNLPNTILESMACGTPVVAYDVGGISDAVKHMKTGILVKSGQIEDLARGIEFLINNEKCAFEMGRNARKMIEENFTIDLQARRFLELYNNLTEICD